MKEPESRIQISDFRLSINMASEAPKIYTLQEIESVVSTPDFAPKLIDAIQEGFVSYSRGEFNAAPIQTMG